jgi:hypothetical protein
MGGIGGCRQDAHGARARLVAECINPDRGGFSKINPVHPEHFLWIDILLKTFIYLHEASIMMHQ